MSLTQMSLSRSRSLSVDSWPNVSPAHTSRSPFIYLYTAIVVTQLAHTDGVKVTMAIAHMQASNC